MRAPCDAKNKCRCVCLQPQNMVFIIKWQFFGGKIQLRLTITEYMSVFDSQSVGRSEWPGNIRTPYDAPDKWGGRSTVLSVNTHRYADNNRLHVVDAQYKFPNCFYSWHRLLIHGCNIRLRMTATVIKCCSGVFFLSSLGQCECNVTFKPQYQRTFILGYCTDKITVVSRFVFSVGNQWRYHSSPYDTEIIK